MIISVLPTLQGYFEEEIHSIIYETHIDYSAICRPLQMKALVKL